MTKIIHPVTFIDKLVKKNELGQPFSLSDHQREGESPKRRPTRF